MNKLRRPVCPPGKPELNILRDGGILASIEQQIKAEVTASISHGTLNT